MLLSCGGDGDDPVPAPSPTANVPSVTTTTPANGQTDVPVGIVDISISYDTKVMKDNSKTITVSGGNAKLKGTSSLADGNQTLNLAVECPDYETLVSVTIPEGHVFNTAGKAAAYTLTFTTAKAPEKPSANITKTLVNGETAQVKKLYSYFLEQYGEKIISSVMANVNWNNDCAEKVNKLTGRYPAMNCYDFIHMRYSPANWIDYSKIDPVKQWYDAGGIVQLMWHFGVPNDEASINNSSNWNSSREGNSFVASNALKEGTWENRVFYDQMEKVANVILQLQDAGIAATWRPYHEAAGNTTLKSGASWGKAWFWWGADGPDVFKQLWIAMFDYFKQRGIKNLIWIWTSQNYNGDKSQFAQDTDWYPGDQYVDMVARDLYGKDAAANVTEFTELQQTYPNKMIALGECGHDTNSQVDGGKISDMWTKGAHWSHFLMWYKGDFGSTGTMASDAWWKDAMSASCVITRDQLPNLK